VLGYELFNEPFPGSSYLTCLGPAGCPAFDRELTAFDRLTAAAIRTVDRRTLIFAEPNVLFDFGAPTDVGALDDPEAGFAFHDYCLASDQPHGCASESAGFQHALAHVARTHEALLLPEFGSTPAAGDLTAMASRADRAMVPWTEWSYCPCHDPTGATPDPLVLDSRPAAVRSQPRPAGA
jgi:endoglycosylceramidase